MNKRMYVGSISVILLTFFFSSCSCFNNIFNTYKKIDTPVEERKIVREEGKAGTSITINDFSKAVNYKYLSSTGDQNVLVIPVYFSDYLPNYFGLYDKEENLKLIYDTFFGDSNEELLSPNRTGWESVRSFYAKSSYGKLNISGQVTSWCNLGVTLKQAINQSKPSSYCLRKAVEWFKDTYPDDVSKYDQNNDGYLDAVCLIYPNDTYSSSIYDSYTKDEKEKIEDLLWAYTSWDNSNDSVARPIANTYMFASLQFMLAGKYKNILGENLADAHTFIHEFGHVLGLDDYYSYDSSDKSNPTGRLDMMDLNIGDHDSYSKYLLNWTSPDLVEKEGTYTISDFGTTGSSLIIPSNLDTYSYSPFGEYLIIEYYSPDNLNELDATNNYQNKYPKLFTREGIKIYSIDTRLVVINKNDKTFYYTAINHDFSNQKNIYLDMGASNTPSKSIEEKRMIRLLNKQDPTDLYYSKAANNNSLFYEGDSLNSFTFNSGESLKYTISIDKLDTKTKTAQIKITSK